MRRFPFALVLGIAAVVCSFTASRATIIPSESAHVKSLDGTWRFKLEQALTEYIETAKKDWQASQPIKTPATFEPFYKLKYVEDESWHDLSVPGNWEMPGFSWATYDQPDNSSGFYRKWVSVPAAWKGRRVLVNFDGVQTGAEIWLNGHPVNVTEASWDQPNYHEGGKTAWQADLTPHVGFGAKNLLALRVTKNTKSADLDSGDFFLLGGIHRSVTLFSVPATSLEDLTITTKIFSQDQAEVKVTAAVAGIGGALPTIAARLGSSAQHTEAAVSQQGAAELSIPIAKPRLWSAEHPNLYKLTVELKNADGKVIESVSRKVGIREVTIKDGILLVNGVPVKLAGVCRHDIYPTSGTAVGRDLWLQDLSLMKEANINAVRTSHYPYGAGFYDLCDEMGLYVVDELPYCQCDSTDNETMRSAFEQRARETLARDKNHPSIIIWAIGNENESGRNLQTVADLVKQIDPTRPRLVSCKPADEYGVELDDAHYPTMKQILDSVADSERRAKWPMIYTENPNIWDVRLGADYGSLDQWVHVLKRNWDVIWKTDGIPGSFLWEWQHRTVADQYPTKIYQFDPETGVQYLKLKGLTDGWRNPLPEYYNVKMVYAPIEVEPTVEPGAKPGSVVLSIWNRYSFTDLSELKTEWQLIRAGKALKTGSRRLSLPPRTAGKIDFDLPKVSGKAPDTLRLDFKDAKGSTVVSYLLALKEPQAPVIPSMTQALPGTIIFPQFHLVTSVTEPDKANWRKVTRRQGQLINVKINDSPSPVDLSVMPFDQVRSMEADIVLDNNPSVVVGHLHAETADMEFKYHIDWIGPIKVHVLELGWVFDIPDRFDHFSWQRQSVWSIYPETHIGRPAGTALPDSANVSLTKITRPDAFDFNSTKYDCDWAQ